MFCQRDIIVEPVGVYRLERGSLFRKSFQRRHSSIGIRLDGSAVFEASDDRITVKSGELIYIPPNISYSQKTEGEEAISVSFIEYSVPSDKIEVIKPKSPDRLTKIFLQMQEAWSARPRGYKALCTSLLYQVFYILSCEAREADELHSSIGSSGLSSALEYIHTHYKDCEIEVRELAKMAYMSDGGFRKSFEKQYKVSPGKYIKLLRLESARALLESGLYTVSETAILSGFSDPKYFSREFSKHYGKSPRRFMNDCQ